MWETIEDKNVEGWWLGKIQVGWGVGGEAGWNSTNTPDVYTSFQKAMRCRRNWVVRITAVDGERRIVLFWSDLGLPDFRQTSVPPFSVRCTAKPLFGEAYIPKFQSDVPSVSV